MPVDALKLNHYKLGTRKMEFINEAKEELKVNEHVIVKGIPVDAQKYQISGRTPLEWLIDRYKIKPDKQSGIVNDPNGWFENPKDIIDAIARIVHVSVETVRIIESLPDPFAD